jgi:hypothetical protein
MRIRLGAESSHVARAEFSPVRENRRKRGSGFSRTELQKTMARSALEGLPQTPGKLGLERRRAGVFD